MIFRRLQSSRLSDEEVRVGLQCLIYKTPRPAFETFRAHLGTTLTHDFRKCEYQRAERSVGRLNEV